MIEQQVSKSIKHLVISGGNIWGLYAFGSLQTCFTEKFLVFDHIQSIHGTSVGALIGVMVATGAGFDILRNYLVNRPWEKLLDKKAKSGMDLYDSRGIFDRELFEGFYSPIFASLDIPIDITLSGFFEKTGIDLHIYVTEIHEFISVDLSHTTHPEWGVIECIHASCSLPVVFSPVLKEGRCYADGGVTMNYPLSGFKRAYPDATEDEVLGILLDSPKPHSSNMVITDASSIIDYVSFLISQIIQNCVFTNKGSGTKFEIVFYSSPITIDYLFDVFKNKEIIENLILEGEIKTMEKLREWNFFTGNGEPIIDSEQC